MIILTVLTYFGETAKAAFWDGSTAGMAINFKSVDGISLKGKI